MSGPIKALVASLVVFTAGLLLLLWRVHADQDAVDVINAVAAIVSLPVSGLIAIALWLPRPTPN